MTARHASKSGARPIVRAVACALVVLAGPATATRPAAQAPAPTPAAPVPTPAAPAPIPAAPAPAMAAPAREGPRRNIAGPGDYALREKMVRLIGHDEELGQEVFRIILVNGGAVFSGPVKNCALKRRALVIASLVRGVINVTDEMSVPRGDVTDAELAKAVVSLLGAAAESLELKGLDVEVADGILTLRGTVKDLASRTRAEEIAGTVSGITRISNRLQSANAPSGADDASLLAALLTYLKDFRNFDFGSDVKVKVERGVVTLNGTVGMCLARQQAALAASQVKGVVRVDNRVKVDPSFALRQPLFQAGA